MITLREAEAKIKRFAEYNSQPDASPEDRIRAAAFREALKILSTAYHGPETAVHNNVNEIFNDLISGEPGNAE